MNLYSVSAIWHRKGERKDWIKTTVIMAETEDEAKDKFYKSLGYPLPDHATVNVSFWPNGIYGLSARKMR